MSQGKAFRETRHDVPLLSEIGGLKRASLELESLQVATQVLEEIAEADELTIAGEYLGRLFAWISQGRTLKQWGLRAWVMVWCVRPDLLPGHTLSQWDRSDGRTKQDVHYYVRDFRRTFGLEASDED